MNRSRGFTLVELLVVIAIITILASIVVPRVTDAIGRARMARAQSEIKGAELAITKMLADVDKQGLDKLFDPVGSLATCVRNAMVDTALRVTAGKMYSDIFYELLRRGKAADFSFTARYLGNETGLVFAPAVKRKLGSSYMDIPMDPWGAHPYYFFAGPLTSSDIYGGTTASPFRCFRVNPINDQEPYIYTEPIKAKEDEIMRGNPRADGGPGYPSAKDLAVYIWSYGDDELSNQAEGGGDDVNNWDSAAGWSAFY